MGCSNFNLYVLLLFCFHQTSAATQPQQRPTSSTNAGTSNAMPVQVSSSFMQNICQCIQFIKIGIYFIKTSPNHRNLYRLFRSQHKIHMTQVKGIFFKDDVVAMHRLCLYFLFMHSTYIGGGGGAVWKLWDGPLSFQITNRGES